MGYPVLEEFFLEEHSNSLDPQSFTNESYWTANWFRRLLVMIKENRMSGGRNVIFADRSPYTACVYAKSGRELMKQVIEQNIKDLSDKNIFLFTIYLNVGREVLWERIQNRLKIEVNREQLGEAKREWMVEVCRRYEEEHGTIWDYVCHINDLEIPSFDLIKKIVLSQSRKEEQQEEEEKTFGLFADITNIFKKIIETKCLN